MIDGWAVAPLPEPERRDFREICEDRYEVRSGILTSQLPVLASAQADRRHSLSDGILDRLVRNDQRIEMRGDSMRKNRAKRNTERSRVAQVLSRWTGSLCTREAIALLIAFSMFGLACSAKLY